MFAHKDYSRDRPLQHPLLDGVRVLEGGLDAGSNCFGIVVSRFNKELTSALLLSALSEFKQYRARPRQVDVVWVPGAFEIPTVLETWAALGHHDAFMALGVVIQGATPHARAIQREVSHSLVEIARRYQRPVIDGVVVADTMELARERCENSEDGRGAHAARTAIEMAQLMRVLKGR